MPQLRNPKSHVSVGPRSIEARKRKLDNAPAIAWTCVLPVLQPSHAHQYQRACYQSLSAVRVAVERQDWADNRPHGDVARWCASFRLDCFRCQHYGDKKVGI